GAGAPQSPPRRRPVAQRPPPGERPAGGGPRRRPPRRPPNGASGPLVARRRGEKADSFEPWGRLLQAPRRARDTGGNSVWLGGSESLGRSFRVGLRCSLSGVRRGASRRAIALAICGNFLVDARAHPS